MRIIAKRLLIAVSLLPSCVMAGGYISTRVSLTSLQDLELWCQARRSGLGGEDGRMRGGGSYVITSSRGLRGARDQTEGSRSVAACRVVQWSLNRLYGGDQIVVLVR